MGARSQEVCYGMRTPLWGRRKHPLLASLPPRIALVDASPVHCAAAMGWDVTWILLLLLIAGQGLTILALSVVLWRRRLQAAPGRGESSPPPWAPPPLPEGRREGLVCVACGGGGREHRAEFSLKISVLHMAASPQMPRFLTSNPRSRSMRTSICPISGEEQLG